MFRPSVTLLLSSLLLPASRNFLSAGAGVSGLEKLPLSKAPSMDPAHEFTVSYVTTPDEKTAKEIAYKLVENKIAACVNIVPQVRSIYKWEEKINDEAESMMIIKTTAERTEDLIKFVKENHPYSVAEVISMPIVRGNEPYLDWVRKSVAKDVKEL